MQLGVKDVAGIFNISENTVYQWIKGRKLPVYRINEQCRFNRAELLEWAAVNRLKIAPGKMLDQCKEDGETPRLDHALLEGGVHYNVVGTDKASVLREVVNLMRLPEEADRSLLHDVLLAREDLGSTGVGNGIAIPHVRNPIVLYISRPMLTLCFLEQEIDFGALDGQPVSILFTLISHTIRSHLHLLSKLAFALRDPEFKAISLNRGSPDKILSEARRIEDSLHVQTTAP